MRNLKHMAVALVAVFAISAIVATAAPANQFHSAVTNTTVTVASNETQAYKYETGGKTVECSTVAGSGEATAQTVTEFVYHPTYSGCVVNGIGGSSAEVSMNGCTFTSTIKAAANEGATHVACIGTSQVTITVKVIGISFCTFHIGKQTPSGLSKYFNSGTTQIKVQANQTGISGSRQGSAECGATTSTTGTVTGSVVLKGVNTGTQMQTQIQVS